MKEFVFIKKGKAIVKTSKSNFEKNEAILKKDGWFKHDPPMDFLKANFDIQEEVVKTKTTKKAKTKAKPTKTEN